MATPADVARKILSKSKAIARAVSETPTGVPPGYHAALGGTVREDGRLTSVSAAGGRLFPALAHASGVTTCVEDAITRVRYNALDFDPHSQISFDDVDGLNWAFSTADPENLYQDIPPTAYFQFGAQALMDTPAFGEPWQEGDALDLLLLRYDSADSSTTTVAILDHKIIQANANLDYEVLLHGTAPAPVPLNSQYYYVGVYNNSRFDRTISGSSHPERTFFWAIPVM